MWFNRSPEGDDIKARFLKHRYFVAKKNIPPVPLKSKINIVF